MKRILIIKLSAIGDVVHSLPLLEVLSGGWPGAEIDWVVEEDAAGILVGHPALCRLYISRRKHWQRALRTPGRRRHALHEIKTFLRHIRSRRYDVVIDLQGLFKSGILAGLVKGRRKIGTTGAREGAQLFWNEAPVVVDYDQHALERYLRLSDYLNCPAGPWEGRIPLSGIDRRPIAAMTDPALAEGGFFLAINPMAGWETKLWSESRFAQLADRLYQRFRCGILFTGGPGDQGVIRRIQARMTAPSWNLAGRTNLKELAFLYTRCRLLITTDTGPMHIAAAMGCPVVALFGPTAPWRTGPYGPRHRVVRADVPCSPCFRRRCRAPQCMTGIQVEDVLEAAAAQLQVFSNHAMKEPINRQTSRPGGPNEHQ